MGLVENERVCIIWGFLKGFDESSGREEAK